MTITLPRLRFLAPLFAASVFCASALGGYFSSGSAGALIACFLLFLLTAAVRPTRREWGMGAIPAALFAFFRTVGYSYDTTDSSDLLLKNAQTMLRGAAAMAALFAAALCAVVLLFRLLDALRAVRAEEIIASLSTPLFSMILSPADEEEDSKTLYLVVPVRLKD